MGRRARHEKDTVSDVEVAAHRIALDLYFCRRMYPPLSAMSQQDQSRCRDSNISRTIFFVLHSVLMQWEQKLRPTRKKRVSLSW